MMEVREGEVGRKGVRERGGGREGGFELQHLSECWGDSRGREKPRVSGRAARRIYNWWNGYPKRLISILKAGR